ncbi:DUF3592 domain-containing protein [Hymenobacter piscis]
MKLIRQGEIVTATVVEVKRTSDDDGYRYSPVYRYTTHANETMTYEPNYSSNPSSWEIGEEAQAAYNPAAPAEVTILTYFDTFGYSIILLALGFAATVLGGGYYLAMYFFSKISQH